MLEDARQVVGMGDQVAGNVGQIDDQDPNIFLTSFFKRNAGYLVMLGTLKKAPMVKSLQREARI